MTERTEREPVPAAPADWRIAETSKRCASCRGPFLPGQEYFSELTITPEQSAFTRADWCSSCWPHHASQAREPIFWKTRRQVGRDDRPVVDVASLHALFQGLLEDARPEVAALRYVVALLLLRKRVLKVVRGAGGARGDLVFRDPRDAERVLRLSTPDLSAETLDQLRAQLGEIVA